MNGVQEFFSIVPWTIIFQYCNLLILCLLIKKFLFKPVMNVLNQRQAEIDGIYDAANEDRARAAALKQDYARHMAGGIEHGAVGAVKLAPCVRIGHLVHRRDSAPGAGQRLRVLHAVAKAGRRVKVQVHGEDELFGLRLPDAVDVFKLHIITENRQRIVDFFIIG